MRMKYKFTIFLFCFYFNTILYSQAPTIQWQKTYGGTDYEDASTVQQTSDSGYIFIGQSYSNNGDVSGNHGTGDAWVVKTNSTGSIQWQKSFGGSSIDGGTSISQTLDGGYIFAGTTKSNNGDITGYHGMFDIWIVKLSPLGNIEWQKAFGSNNDDFVKSVRQTSDGGYILAGTISSGNGDVLSFYGVKDIWVVKLDSLGNITWQKTLGGSGWEEANSIEQTSDGGYIIAGTSNSANGDITGNNGGYDYWIVKISPTGILQWQKSLGGSLTDKAYSIKQTPDGGFIIAGASNSTNGDITGNNGGYDYWIVKLFSTGDIQWQKSFGGSYDSYAMGVDNTTDGGYIITGCSQYLNQEGNPPLNIPLEYLILKLNAFGNVEWQNHYGGSFIIIASSIQQTSDGGYILGGQTNMSTATNNSYADYNYKIIKLAGNQLSTNETIIKNNISIYPNPVKDFVTIDRLPIETTISIHDLSGRKIFTKKYSETKVTINTSTFSNGVYIIQVDDQEKTVLSEKLIIKR